MSKLKQWDMKALLRGNWEKSLSVVAYRTEKFSTQIRVVGAWGRKINLIWLGQWKGSNA